MSSEMPNVPIIGQPKISCVSASMVIECINCKANVLLQGGVGSSAGCSTPGCGTVYVLGAWPILLPDNMYDVRIGMGKSRA